MADSFRWTEKAGIAALALAEGKTVREAATESAISERQMYRLKLEPEFSAEVDRLSLMVGVASRAERLRLAQRVVRQRTDDDGMLTTKADLLDWLKFAQSETDGIKLDLAKLATALGATDASMANRGSD